MKLLITGGAGFLGARLARTLLSRGMLGSQRIDRIVLADQFAPPADLVVDTRVHADTGPLLNQCAHFAAQRFDGVFHLASAVSGECELDFDLGMRSNFDSTRALLDALRAAGNVPRLVFSSSVAVFGPALGRPLPPIVTGDTLPTPQYQTRKIYDDDLGPKYITCAKSPPGNIVLAEGGGSEICLVEDIISSIKVGQVMDSVALLSTNINSRLLETITSWDKFYIWLDMDNPQVIRQGLKLLKILGNMGETKLIKTPKDPKYYTTDEIKSILYGT